MSISTVWLHVIDELAEELFDLMVEEGFKDMAETITTVEMYDIIRYAAQVAANRTHTLPHTTHEYLERIRNRLRTTNTEWNEYLPEFVDEIYLGIAHDFPERVCDDGNFYEVICIGSNLFLKLLLSERAISLMDIDLGKIANQVY